MDGRQRRQVVVSHHSLSGDVQKEDKVRAGKAVERSRWLRQCAADTGGRHTHGSEGPCMDGCEFAEMRRAFPKR